MNSHFDYPLQNTIHTSWYIISGGPSSGKTSIIKGLSNLGFKTTEDVGRKVLNELKDNNIDILKFNKSQDHAFQRRVLQEKINYAKNFSPQELIFFDTSIIECFVYFLNAGLPGEETLGACHRYRHKGIFILNQLDEFEFDGIRRENKKEAFMLNDQFKDIYKKLGYDFITVPVLPIEKRLEFILSRVEKQ